MQNISDFFARIGACLDRVQIEELGDVVLLPTTVYFGSDVHFMSGKAQFSRFMTDYANRLKLRGVCETTCDVVSQEALRNDGVRATILWKHRDAAGDTVVANEINYFCRPENGSWKIALIEFVSKPDDILKATRLSI